MKKLNKLFVSCFSVSNTCSQDRNNRTPLSEYWCGLKKSIRVLFVISCILFVAEMVYDYFIGTNWDYTKYVFKTIKSNLLSNFDFENAYYFVFPLLYIVVTIVIVYMRKISAITLLFLLILRITYPTTAELILTILIAIPIGISRS